MSLQLPGKPASADSTAVISSAIASGGLVGAGLAILALQLPARWLPAAVAIVPTLSSSCALAVRVVAAEIRRRYSIKLWEKDRAIIVAYVERAIPASAKALIDISDSTARQILEVGMARMQRVRALALSALPHERPWLSELQQLADSNLKTPRSKRIAEPA
jgi:hypothetical protein